MHTHYLTLTQDPFNAIASGIKTIESRLYDEKRRRIQLGDQVVFTNRNNTSQTVTVRVIGLLRYRTFHDLFLHNNPKKFGGENIEWLERQIHQFYSMEAQLENGVVGIEFVMV